MASLTQRQSLGRAACNKQAFTNMAPVCSMRPAVPIQSRNVLCAAAAVETKVCCHRSWHLSNSSSSSIAAVEPFLNLLQVSSVADLTNLDRVSILAEALPYMQRFAGKTVVVKYGGAAMKDPTLKVCVANLMHAAAACRT